MWRQGDLLIERVRSVPPSATARPNLILAEGELTGHAHRINSGTAATLFADDDDLYLAVEDEAVIVHEEHGAVTLDRGHYRVWRQREYSPGEIRTVRD